eukprot:476615-Ditylum_brightwellii.AAC.1
MPWLQQQKPKLGTICKCAEEGGDLCTAFEEMEHPQLLTPIITDNTTANGIVNDTIDANREIFRSTGDLEMRTW